MKKLSAIIIAMALVLGLSQCKKQETPTTTDPDDGMVYITVNVGDNGAKHTVYPNHGFYGFDNDDTLYVANNGHYIGALRYQNGAFSGSISSPSTSDYLHFYFLGGKTPATAPEAGTTTSFTISIADQTDNLPIISYGRSAQLYHGPEGPYSTTLRNKFALVKFATNDIPTRVPVTISGMNNQVSINLVDNSFTNSKVGDGNISLYAESQTVRWGILLPQGEVNDAVASAEGYVTTPAFTVPQHGENDYLNEGIALNLVFTAGAINSKFSVGIDPVTGDTIKVFFSQGNLQYQPSSNTWRFAEHQYDYIGKTTMGEAASSAWIDLMGWGTSGYNHGANYYQPYMGGTYASDYYPYGSNSCNLYDRTGKADWGYNAILNGGNTENYGWRTLRQEECGFLFTERTNAASKYGHGRVNNGVNDVKGMILLPDEWSLPDGLYFTSGNSDWINYYTAEEWIQMEANGAVFLPAAGYRFDWGGWGGQGTVLRYWSSSRVNTSDAYCINVESNQLAPQNPQRYYGGFSVRLVRTVE